MCGCVGERDGDRDRGGGGWEGGGGYISLKVKIYIINLPGEFSITLYTLTGHL